MKGGKTAMLTLALALMLQGASLAYSSEIEPVWSIDEEGIKIEAWTPEEAYPGDNITLTVKVKAKEDITNVHVTIRLQASKGDCTWETYLHPLENEELASQTFMLRNCNFSVPAEALPGATLGHIYCSWKVYRSHVWRDRFHEDSFQAVHLGNREFEQLQQSYADLNTTHQQLQQSYGELNNTYFFTLENLEDLNKTYQSILSDLEDLQSKYEGLESGVSGARNLSYCFVATTIILAGSTGFLLLKKKKEQKTEA